MNPWARRLTDSFQIYLFSVNYFLYISAAFVNKRLKRLS